MPEQGPAPGPPRRWVVFLTVFIDLLGFGLIIPVAPYFAKSYGATDAEVAWLTGAYSLTQFIFVPFWGRLSDRIGRRPVMLVSVLGTAVALAFFGWAPSLTWLFVARAAHGAMTANLATAQAYMADITTDADRAKAMGFLGAAFGLGFIVGPFMGGLLADLGKSTGLGYALVGYGGAALSFANFVFAWFFLEEPHHKQTPNHVRHRITDLFRRPRVAVLVGAGFASTFAFANMTSTYAILTIERLGWTSEAGGERFNGYVFGLIGIVGAGIQGGLLGRLVAAFREPRLIVVGLFAMGGGLALLGVMHTLGVLLVASLLLTVGNSLSTPSLSSLISLRTPAEEQGSVFGAFQSLGSLGRLLGPIAGGSLYGVFGSTAPYALGAGVMALAALAVWWAEGRPPRGTPP